MSGVRVRVFRVVLRLFAEQIRIGPAHAASPYTTLLVIMSVTNPTVDGYSVTFSSSSGGPNTVPRSSLCSRHTRVCRLAAIE